MRVEGRGPRIRAEGRGTQTPKGSYIFRLYKNLLQSTLLRVIHQTCYFNPIKYYFIDYNKNNCWQPVNEHGLMKGQPRT